MKQIKLAHRGYSDKYKENTKEAIEASIGYFDGVEIDIRLTKDKEFILMHDSTLDRTTLLKGKVEEFNLSEILNADSSVYTLREFLDQFGTTFKYVNIDMKNCSKVCDIAEERLITLLEEYDLTNTTYIISSYFPDSLNEIRELTDKYKLALLISESSHLKNIGKVNNWDYLSVLDTFKGIKEFNKDKLMVWSKNEKTEFEKSKILIQDIQ